MKTRLICFFALLSFVGVQAQTLDDIGRLCIHVSPVVDSKITPEACKVLESKMDQIVSSSGIADNGIDRRFEITASIVTLSKDIISGPPTKIAQKFEVTFSICDIIEKKTFGSVSLNVAGVGFNEIKSSLTAFNSIKPNNSHITEMMNSAKELIIQYYRSNINKILKDAKTLADREYYDGAIALLSTVPYVCEEEYELCQENIYSIYQRKVNSEGEAQLALARAAWAASPDSLGAQKAIKFLNGISILSSCNSDVKPLLDEITEKLKADQKTAIEFRIKQYEDDKAREQRDFEFQVRKYESEQRRAEREYEDTKEREKRDFNFAMRKYEDEAAYQRAVLDASKEVALAYIKKQK